MAEDRNKESETTQDRTFELPSEKVRSIVGQIPSRLIRYGTMVIALILLTLVGISTLLPYRKITSGTLVINNIQNNSVLNVSIQFPDPTIATTAKNCPIHRKG